LIWDFFTILKETSKVQHPSRHRKRVESSWKARQFVQRVWNLEYVLRFKEIGISIINNLPVMVTELGDVGLELDARRNPGQRRKLLIISYSPNR